MAISDMHHPVINGDDGFSLELRVSPMAALMMAIGLLASPGPARRGLAVQPTEALREE